MTVEAEPIGRQPDTENVVGAIDEIDGRPHLVIADIAREDVWLSMTERETVSLDEWR